MMRTTSIEHTRVQFDFYIGLKEDAREFETLIITEVCAIAGGCTVSRDTGYWLEGAGITRDRYYGSLTKELCFHIQFSVEVHRSVASFYAVKAAIWQLARKYDIDTDWVHVTEQEIKVRHFSVQGMIGRE